MYQASWRISRAPCCFNEKIAALCRNEDHLARLGSILPTGRNIKSFALQELSCQTSCNASQRTTSQSDTTKAAVNKATLQWLRAAVAEGTQWQFQ